MSSAWLVGLELALVLGGVLAFGLFELWRLRRDKHDAARRDPPSSQ